MTLDEIIAESSRLLNDPNQQRWSSAILTARANMAQSIVQNYVNAVKVRESLTPVANTAELPLNANTMDVLEVIVTRSNGDRFPIQGTTRYDMNFDFPTWRNWDAGEPKTYLYEASNQQIILIPKPDSNNAITNGIDVLEVRNPTAVSSGSDVPFDSNASMGPYTLAVVHWIVAQSFLDDSTPEALSKSQFHRSGSLDRPGVYETHIKRLLDNFDIIEDAPTRIKWSKQGGRIGGWGPTKSNPLGGW